MTLSPVRVISRRDALKHVGAGIALVPLAVACTGDDSTADGSSSSSSSSSGSASSASSGQASSSSGQASSAAAATAWATGGTAAMTALASYPDPFAGSTPQSCALICQTTLGPCHTTSLEREDVTNGRDGIPVRLALRILDSACMPAAGAIVEIWQTDVRGIYSGQINTLCNTDAADRADNFMRGHQVADSQGRVNFNTVFPGWYRGRCVHIHVRIQAGSYQAADNAAAEVITQLVFSDEVVQSIFNASSSESVPLYSAYGVPDTLLGTDNVVGSVTDKSPYVPDTQRMPDGAMLASKTLVIRRSTQETLCTAGR